MRAELSESMRDKVAEAYSREIDRLVLVSADLETLAEVPLLAEGRTIKSGFLSFVSLPEVEIAKSGMAVWAQFYGAQGLAVTADVGGTDSAASVLVHPPELVKGGMLVFSQVGIDVAKEFVTRPE